MNFPSNLNCDGKIVSEMGPRFEKDDTSMTFIQVAQMVFAKAVI